MLLYHGTNGTWLNNILRRGLEPRGRRPARDNWKHVPHRSNPSCVYLTDSYAPYFAFNAARGRNPSCAVIEIDTDLLNEGNLFSDEDFIEQASRDVDDPVPGTMSQRTLYFRARQFEYVEAQDPDTLQPIPWWRASLRYLGTCCHRGTIPPNAITRAVTWPHVRNAHLAFIWDPTITVLNQHIMGNSYRALTRKLLAGEFENPRSVTSEERLTRLMSHDPVLPPINGWRLVDRRSALAA